MVKASYKSYSIIINLIYLSIIFVFLRNTHHSSILLTHELIILGDQTMWVSPSVSPSCGLLGLWGLGISTLRQPVSQLPLCHAAAMPLASLGDFFLGRNAAGLVISLGFYLIYRHNGASRCGLSHVRWIRKTKSDQLSLYVVSSNALTICSDMHAFACV